MILLSCAAVVQSQSATLGFSQVSAPYTNFEKHQVRSSSSMNDNGVMKNVIWKTLIRSNQTYNGVTFGALKTKTGGPVFQINNGKISPPLPATSKSTNLIDISKTSGLDFSSFIPEGPNSNYYRVVSHMEDGLGQMNSFRTLFNPSTCSFGSISDMKVIDFSSVGGTWIPCAGSISPWATHLGSEEYEPDAK